MRVLTFALATAVACLATAAPALAANGLTTSAVNMRIGPGTSYQVIVAIPGPPAAAICHQPLPRGKPRSPARAGAALSRVASAGSNSAAGAGRLVIGLSDQRNRFFPFPSELSRRLASCHWSAAFLPPQTD